MTSNAVDITTPLELPCGSVLPNRLGKSALTEGLADTFNRATDRHLRLYERWSQGGCGLLMTGNVQVDRRYLERAGNVALEADAEEDALERLRALAVAGQSGGNQLWMQIGHAGRQVSVVTNPNPVGPSAVPLDIAARGFGTPRELSVAQIQDVIERFAFVASQAKKAGFSGAQVHSAHGYLISSFLSPKANKRKDDWGGSLKNRARLLLETIEAVRSEVGTSFPVGVKLNSSDFQKDGFSPEECLQVAGWLDDMGLDLLELSGGNYESPSMMKPKDEVAESTRKREAYFLEYAEAVNRKVQRTPVMVTGGFRSRRAMDAALASSACDLIGLGRPLCSQPDAANILLASEDAKLEPWEERLPRSKAISWYYRQIFHMADGQEPDLELDAEEAATWHASNEMETAQALQGRVL